MRPALSESEVRRGGGTTVKLPALSLALMAALAGNAGSQQAPQEPTPTFPAQVEQVTVDVVVTDGKGQPVADLTRDDLEVHEDGVRQAIVSFDVFRASVAGAAPSTPG